jgi:hypothetical protein
MFSIFELQIFVNNFWQNFSPIWSFFSKLCHFSVFTCFVLEVPEISDFRPIFEMVIWEKADRLKNMRRMKLKIYKKLFHYTKLIYKKIWVYALSA